MYHNLLSRTKGRNVVPATHLPSMLPCLVLAALFWAIGCNKNSPTDITNNESPPQYQFETTGEEFLISALDEIESIADYARRAAGFSLPSKTRKIAIASSESDTVYVYGEVTPDGYGAVVTERHTYPKGLLLITVRKSYGKPSTKIVTQTKRYITYEEFLNDSAQQSNITEVYGLTTDTIVTHVTRNGVVETYTFRLPVITRVTNPDDGSVRVTSRYGAAGKVHSEIRDGNGNLIQFRETYGDSTGALTTYTEFADASWRNVRTIGLADGSVHREITSGP